VAVVAGVVAVSVHAMTGADAANGPSPSSGPPAVAGPVAVMPADVLTSTLSNGDTANAAYAYLSARQDRLVHLQLTLNLSVRATVSKTSTITLLSGCTDTSTTPSCADNLNPAGLKLIVSGSGITVKSSNGGLSASIVGDAQVGGATRDSNGF
jgi:hypothetical protein